MRIALYAFTLLAISLSVIECAWAQEFANFCRPNGKVSLFLVDRTTTFDEIDSGDFIQGFQRIYDRTGAGDRLIVHDLTTDALATRPIFDACRPVCGDGFLDILSCDQASARRANLSYVKNVVDRFRTVLKKKEGTSKSVLLEGITLLTEEYRPLKIERLYIFSDLLENSDVTAAARLLDPSATQSLLDSAKAKGLTPSIQGAMVRVFGVGRWHDSPRRGLRLPERRALGAFWEQWFKSGGASTVTISERYLTD